MSWNRTVTAFPKDNITWENFSFRVVNIIAKSIPFLNCPILHLRS